MAGPATTEPLRLSLDLACPAGHAFTTWTARFATWWPAGHSTSGDPRTRVRFEAHAGGRIYETTPDGTEIDWGEVIEYDPPRRVVYTWHIRRDRADATTVQLSFIRTGEESSRLEILHSGWERLGAGGPAWRDANRGGWAGLLPHFLAAVTR